MFYNCYDLYEINIDGYALSGETEHEITEIPVGAFYRCFSLMKMNDNDSDGIDEIILNDTVETIETYSFALSKAFKNLCIPISVKTIGKGAFTGCVGMESVETPFVGESRGSDDEEGLFGWIYGETIFYDYVDENVSTKVVKIIQSYTNVVNKFVWRKE